MSALVQVQSVYELTGTGQQIGGVTAAQLAEVQARLAQIAANKAAAAAAAAANGVGGGGVGTGTGAGPGPFDPRGAFQIPNNFWGFAILMMGLR